MLKPQMLKPQTPRRSNVPSILIALALCAGFAAGFNICEIGLHADEAKASVEAPKTAAGGDQTPIVFRCGTGPMVSGDDARFMITTGDNAHGCDVLFTTRYELAPNCYVTGGDRFTYGLHYESTPLTLRIGGVDPNATYHVRCESRDGTRSAGANVINYSGYGNAGYMDATSGTTNRYGLWTGTATIGDASNNLDVLTIGSNPTITFSVGTDTHTFYPDGYDTVTIRP